MDISVLDSVTQSNKGMEVEIKHPKTGKGMGAFITVLGVDSTVYHDVTVELGKKLTPETSMSEFDVERLVRCTLGWKGFEEKGEELRFSEVNLRKVFKSNPCVKEQLLDFYKERSNFLPEPEKGSATL
jgi:hypothetical protein